MIKTKTIETVEEYDTEGKLLKKTVTETEETDDNPVKYSHTSTPWYFEPFRYVAGPTCQTTFEAKGE